MCGFAGVVQRPGGRAVSRAELAVLLADLRHRGPDGEGVFAAGSAGLAATRLRIQGDSSGDQPHIAADGRSALAFNGEVLPAGAEALRRRLREGGGTPPPASAGDTPLLAAALAAGACPRCALRGSMGAVVAVGEDGSGLLARDRFGIKPLHFVEDDDGAWFASELTPLLRRDPSLRRPDPAGLAELFAFHRPGPTLPFARVREVAAGTAVSLDGGAAPADCAEHAEPERSRTAAPAELGGSWRDAAREAAAVEGPVSVFLSGGLDSAAVAAWCGRSDLLALTARFPPAGGPFDESEGAAAVAAHLGLRHRVVDLRDEDLLEDLPDMIRALEMPVAGPGALALWRLARVAREEGRVVLTGTGGDELLAGYARDALALGRAGPWTAGYEPLARRMDAAGTNPGARWRAAMDRRGDLRPFLAPEFHASLPEPAALLPDLPARATAGEIARAERRESLPVLLLVEDRVTMAHGLEGRPVPCLGRVADVAERLPDEWLVGPDGEGKRALREALRGVIPESVRTDRRKRGFPTPFARAVLGAGRARARAIVEDRRFRERGWWNLAACRRALDEEHPGHDRSLYALLSWETWARLFLDGEAFR